ncbi:MAG: hypothetical protein KatS3mg129_0969 [Leptospiraceae bacterium]|nr:MAG: hypothetical protein KatS3mg129_0969 [Leptospiraceae bacterium]
MFNKIKKQYSNLNKIPSLSQREQKIYYIIYNYFVFRITKNLFNSEYSYLDAEDLAQELIIIIFERHSKFINDCIYLKISFDDFIYFLNSFLKNHLYNHIRKQNKQDIYKIALNQDSNLEFILDQFIKNLSIKEAKLRSIEFQYEVSNLLQEIIDFLINNFGKQKANIFIDSFFFDLPYKEIAEKYNININTVKTIINRELKRAVFSKFHKYFKDLAD